MNLIIFSFSFFLLLSSQPAHTQDHHVDASANHERENESVHPEEHQKKIHDSHAEVHWSYAGENGPESWASLKPEYNMCKSGHHQSPVDLRWKQPSKGHELVFHYKTSKFKIIDNGHTIQVNFDAGNTVSIGEKEYDLLQLHFHSTSEHTIAGKYYPMEMHMVHKNTKGQLAVVGFVFEEGKNNPSIEKIWGNIPAEKNKEVAAVGNFNPADFVPGTNTHYHYTGSLTTPPCSEGVNWNVFNTPVSISKNQLDKFRKLYHGTNRPVQKLFDRKPANY